MSRRRIENTPVQRKRSIASDDFGDADIDDDTLVQAVRGDLDFEHIDNFASPTDVMTRNNTARNKLEKEKGQGKLLRTSAEEDDGLAPIQLPNGRWVCSHKCKDKEACKHYCCKHGMDKPPKKAAPKRAADQNENQPSARALVQKDNKTQTKLQLQASKRRTSCAIDQLDLTQQDKKRKTEYAINGPRDYRDLHNLHKNVQKKDVPSSLLSVMRKKPDYCYDEGGEHRLSFLSQPVTARPKTSSDYGDLQFDEMSPEPSPAQTRKNSFDQYPSPCLAEKPPVTSRGSNTFGDDDSMFDEAIVGLADSDDLRIANAKGTSITQDHVALAAMEVTEEFADIDFPVVMDFSGSNNDSPERPKQDRVKLYTPERSMPAPKSRSTVLDPTISPMQHSKDLPRAKSMFQYPGSRDLQQGQAIRQRNGPIAHDEVEDDDIVSDLINFLDNPSVKDKDNDAQLKQDAAEHETTEQSVQVKEEKPKEVPGGFQDLQPWLYQEFGDIIELVDE